MQCPQCQHENAPDAKFCNECGTPLASRCPACETENGDFCMTPRNGALSRIRCFVSTEVQPAWLDDSGHEDDLCLRPALQTFEALDQRMPAVDEIDAEHTPKPKKGFEV